ncbi:GntR family transcriptional regulator [Hyphomicrobium sp. DMF-1]|uniref:GntR family transcriptional regulator n=1 Tax=Hyphomicrobium sp. DMF-1 TaxID=3019544 RepID=UPI0022EBF236|nr:GntR family transcriptional regulator [Hyphomicrobium sp. DMF-1]WBT39158.1 GntR family transcriptional regulator [Hyphomicrobium sp. DMF-1]
MPDLETRLAARPLYLQVRDVLVQRIVVGHWKPGATLPNETQLAQQLGISIGTVRKALDLMEVERIVTRRQGRGTFVNDYAAAENTFPFSMFHDFSGHRISGQKRARSVTRIQASLHEAERMGVRKGDELIKVDRVREHQGQIFLSEICLLPAKLFSRIPEDFGSYRLSALAQLNAILVGRADESVDIVMASEEDGENLNVPPGTPLLRLDRLIYSDHEDVLEWWVAHCFMRNERYLVRFN